MVDYKKMYTIMFNAATDALSILGDFFDSEYLDLMECACILSNAQMKCEDIFIESKDNKIT